MWIMRPSKLTAISRSLPASPAAAGGPTPKRRRTI
jgi:hypothetical protein